ncbi:hypothetical protein L484_019308 [Morus notabilis]|uniref:Uncharacterized protein n=1 Tax=Morus notabilis TaxID=981085 RepID=W9RAX1_9ROSA|nr:hypothetical protein L484_019308 [Morus notabilis]
MDFILYISILGYPLHNVSKIIGGQNDSEGAKTIQVHALPIQPQAKRALYKFGSAPHRQNPDTTDSREPQIWTQPCCRTTTPPSSSWRLPVRAVESYSLYPRKMMKYIAENVNIQDGIHFFLRKK